MRKFLFAALLTTLATPGIAEVAISGLLQAQMIRFSGGGVPSGIHLSDGQSLVDGHLKDPALPPQRGGRFSTLALSASEPLASELRIFGRYSLLVDPTASNNNGSGGVQLYQAESFVGLEGSMGQLRLGRMILPYADSTLQWDPFIGLAEQARGNFGYSNLHFRYQDNSVIYALARDQWSLSMGLLIDEKDRNSDGEADNNHGNSFSFAWQQGAATWLAATLDDEDGRATKVAMRWQGAKSTWVLQHERLHRQLEPTATTNPSYTYANYSYLVVPRTRFSIALARNNLGMKNDLYLAIGYNRALSERASWNIGWALIDDNEEGGVATRLLSSGFRLMF
jgi:hypothetical protein